MLSNFLLSFEAVCPMFLIIAAGYTAKKLGMIDDRALKQVNKVLFNIAFPCTCFKSLYGAEFDLSSDARFILYCWIVALACWILACPLVMKIEKSNKRRGAMVQAMNRTNYLVIGLPILHSICGDTELAFVTVALSGLILISNVISIVVMELFRGGKPDPKHMAKSVFINPIILATLLGIVTMVTGITIPAPLASAASSLGGAATPIALLMIGASIDFKHMGDRIKPVIICVTGKLIILPLIAAAGGVLMGFRGVEFVALLILFGPSPTTTSYTVADQMGSDGDLARDCVVIASALVAFTMFLWIFLFRSLGMF